MQNKGLWATIVEVVRFLQRRYQNYKEDKIDRLYGTKSGGFDKDFLKQMKSPSVKDAKAYEPIKHEHFSTMLNDANINHSNNIFIDLGAGKGRALMYASEFPFAKIIGIEFSNQLYDQMQQNINHFLNKTDKTDNFILSCEDAMNYKFPTDSDITVYLNNPFSGDVMRSVIGNIQNYIIESNYQIKILYAFPFRAEMFNQEFLILEKEVKKPHYNIYRGL